MTDISKPLIGLLSEDRFYADVMMRLNRVYTRDVKTLSISLDKGGTLKINPDFWALNEEHQAKLLKHECLHLILDHFGRAKDTDFTEKTMIAADLATNCLIRDFPNTMNSPDGPVVLMTVDNVKQVVPSIEHDKSFEYYLEFLKNLSQEDMDKISGGSETVDEHGDWKNEDYTQEEAKAVVRDLVDKAVQSCKNAGKQVPDAIRAYVEALYDSGLGWEEILKSVPECAEVSYYEASRKRRNRRYGVNFPGEKVVRRCEVVVGMDVSGSIGDEILAKLTKVLDEIRQKANVKILVFDHAIQLEADYEPGLFENGVPGGGGTLFKPVFDRAKELNADALIMLTDGMCGDQFNRPPFPTFWGILEGFKSPVDWGTTVILK